MTRLVGLDVGTSSVKGVVIDGGGAVVDAAEAGYALSLPRPGWVEQDPEDWWRAAEAVLDRLGASRADAIGLTGQMHGLVALDAAGRPLRPAILWNDGRAGDQCAAVEERIGLQRLVEVTGNRPQPGFTAPKLLWMREHEPELYRRIAQVLLPKDYVRLRLCGERATDVADASGTLLLDLASRRWSAEVVDALELDAGWLAPVHEAPEVVATAFGGVPVVAGAGDQAAGALGVGVLAEAGPASVVLGTSGVVLMPCQRPVHDPDALLHAFCHAAPGVWHVMGVMLSAAGALGWVRRATGAAPFATLLAEAASWPPGVDGLLFAPSLSGERLPHADPDARGAFVGAALGHDRGALARAVLEGVAFGLREALELVERAVPVGALCRVSGGGARSDLWLEILASALGRPLEVRSDTAGAAYGAALLAGVGAGVWAGPAEAVDACVRVARTVEPRADWAAAYQEALPRFRALAATLREARATTGPADR